MSIFPFPGWKLTVVPTKMLSVTVFEVAEVSQLAAEPFHPATLVHSKKFPVSGSVTTAPIIVNESSFC
jgi:hypothetical protein